MASNLPQSEEPPHTIEPMDHESEEENEDEELEGWDDWEAQDDDVLEEEEEEEGSDSNFLCLFCDSKYGSCDALLDHCISSHRFDFRGVRTKLGLDFYGAVKLINYIRSQVAESRCWICGVTCESGRDLQNHIHETVNIEDVKPLWDDDRYLKPFMEDDSLLYSFGEDEEDEDGDDYSASIDKDELMRDLKNFEEIYIGDDNTGETILYKADNCGKNGRKGAASASNGCLNIECSSEKAIGNGMDSRECVSLSGRKLKDTHLRGSFPTIIAKDIKNVNEHYFGAYSSFGIHREMISDKVRTDAYRQAILKNPSLLNSAVVLDVGCGTGILSLFAAQAGASRVIAVEASEKMAAVATQIAMENGLWRSKSQNESNKHSTGVIEVVQGMVEELDKSLQIQPHSVDVLLSEWMGYCLLYESMLSSVLFARDRWLKPGGAILPDTATIFVAGFGKGGTSLPFWEDVYGFNMSCIGKELVGDAAKIPIVDVVDNHDIVTNSTVLQTFDLATMNHDDVDFTASVELEPYLGSSTGMSKDLECQTRWCYGVVLWFETGFTSRFCKEMPVVLSTSPHTPKTHWSQTILTFPEPIAMASGKLSDDRLAAVGTDACPAMKIHLCISIARAVEHRSIDISLETAGIGSDGSKRKWPVQIFNLC